MPQTAVGLGFLRKGKRERPDSPPATAPVNHGGMEQVLAQVQRNLDRQEASLESVRGRALTVLGVGSVVSGLATSGLIGKHATGLHLPAAITALSLFGVSVVLALYSARPQKWTFSGTLQPFIDDFKARKAVTPSDVHYNVAKDMQKWHDANAIKLKSLYTVFAAACVVTALEVIAWILTAL